MQMFAGLCRPIQVARKCPDQSPDVTSGFASQGPRCNKPCVARHMCRSLRSSWNGFSSRSARRRFRRLRDRRGPASRHEAWEDAGVAQLLTGATLVVTGTAIDRILEFEVLPTNGGSRPSMSVDRCNTISQPPPRREAVHGPETVVSLASC